MTIRDLKSQVSSLCFTDIRDGDLRFIGYANLALRTIYNEISVIKEKRIKLSEKPLFYTEKLFLGVGESKTLKLSGSSYSMVLSGRGSVIIDDGQNKVSKSFDTEETAFCGFLRRDGNFTFKGEGDLYVYCLASFKEGFDGQISKIPVLKRRIALSMREHTADFHSFICAPLDQEGKTISDAALVDDKIILKRPYFGEICVMYKRLPEKIPTHLHDKKIDIPESCEDLLCILTSYFILLEDEKELAEHFKSIYNDLIKKGRNNLYERIGGEYADVNGWA